MSGRDLALEESVLRQVGNGAGVDRDHLDDLVANVLARAQLGADQYGDGEFMQPGRDNIGEGIDEAADLCAYPLMEVQRVDRTRDLTDHDVGQGRMWLLVAVQKAIEADDALRLASEFLGRD